MFKDNVAAFVKKYGEQAKMKYVGIPDQIHPHILRHTGLCIGIRRHATDAALRYPWPCAETTKIYAYADTAMKREAIEKANGADHFTVSEAIWKNDRKMIQKSVGLKVVSF